MYFILHTAKAPHLLPFHCIINAVNAHSSTKDEEKKRKPEGPDSRDLGELAAPTRVGREQRQAMKNISH